MDLGLKGKVAVVTGGSKGIGRAIAEEFAKEGAHVSICARGQHELANAAEELRRYGVTAVATPADVTNAEDVERVLDTTLTSCGRVDILVNNAGSAWFGHGVDTPDEQWRYAFDVNLQSAIRFTRGVIPSMRQQGGGRIINIATAYARTVFAPGTADYGAAKAGLLHFSRLMAMELAPDNILVNAVCPGFIHSPLHAAQRAAVVPAAYDFSHCETLVDVGGGEGRLLTAILKANPKVKGILFDLPLAVEGATRRVAAEQLSERCACVAGDFFDAVPSGGDTYLLSLVIHDWPDDRARAILESCHRAMRTDGKLLLVERILPSRPDRSVTGQHLFMMDLNMLVVGGGLERTEEEFRSLLAAAGFKLAQVIPTQSVFSLIEGVRV